MAVALVLATPHSLAQPSKVVEIIGPPGSGKSTLIEALSAVVPGTRPLSIYCTPRNLPLWVGSGFKLFFELKSPPLSESSPWQKRRWMIRLQAAEGILRREARGRPGLLIFDQGPVYTLARLGDAAGTLRRTHAPIEWERGSIRFWAAALDALIMLDAPDEILLERIRVRSKQHSLRAASNTRARRGLKTERALHEATVEKLIKARGSLSVVRFDTAETSMDRIITALHPILNRPAPVASEGVGVAGDDGSIGSTRPDHNQTRDAKKR